MTMQPAVPPGGTTAGERLLFTPGPRLGWVFRDRRQLLTPYPEPEPDPEAITGQLAARLTVALAVAGVAWPAWCYARLALAGETNPARAYQAAREKWRQRADEHEHAQLARLGGIPEWASARSPGQRTDIYGGTLGGWQALLAVHGASILAGQPLLVADFSGQLASGELAALARRHAIPAAVHLLPTALDASGILAGLSPAQFANALAEAIHAGTSGGAGRADRAVDLRVIEHLTAALGASLTPARLAAAVEAALGQPVPPGLLTPGETELIGGDLFPNAYRAQITPSLVRLDAFLSGLARHTGTGPPRPARPAWYTCLALEPGARSARAELLTALTVQWLTVRVTQSTATVPAVIIAGADEVTRDHLEALAGACERRGVPLTLLFRHLRDDATALIGGAGATAFMRLGNHNEAEQAATFIGRHHKFTVSGWTVTRGGDHSTTRTAGYSQGTSQTRGRTDDGLFPASPFGGHTRSRDYGRNQEWSESDAESDGENWSNARNTQRVYEYAVEPAVLQNLPGNALLLPARGTARPGVLTVECDPQIITLPGASADLPAPDDPGTVSPVARTGGWPALTPPGQQPPWPAWRDDPAGSVSAWPPQRPAPRWPRQPG